MKPMEVGGGRRLGYVALVVSVVCVAVDGVLGAGLARLGAVGSMIAEGRSSEVED